MEAGAAEGLTVILSSHLIGDLERVCDHLVILNQGRVHWPGAQWRLTWLALLAVPCLAGMFIGAPIFAAEREHSIHRLALAQSVTRLGLIVPRLVLVMAPRLAAGSLLGALGLHAYAHSGWIQKFDHQVPVLVAYVAFSLTLGVAAGLVCSRTLPAMVVTFIGYVGIRGWIEGYVRPYYLPPLTRPVAMGKPINLGSSDLVLSGFGSIRTMTAYEI